MQLIGMLDSPYVRRVAISLRLMGIDFEHRSLSVFGDFDDFAKVNPVVKAPTLLLNCGTVLMDSTLILNHLERLCHPDRRLRPADLAQHARAMRLTGLALAACEKTVQLVYELKLRPAERQHAPWVSRVRHQLSAAYRELEDEEGKPEAWTFGDRLLGVDVDMAVAWTFATFVLPGELESARYPNLVSFAAKAEMLPEFQAFPLT